LDNICCLHSVWHIYRLVLRGRLVWWLACTTSQVVRISMPATTVLTRCYLDFNSTSALTIKLTLHLELHYLRGRSDYAANRTFLTRRGEQSLAEDASGSLQVHRWFIPAHRKHRGETLASIVSVQNGRRTIRCRQRGRNYFLRHSSHAVPG
jgi:hypothetical protein